jgi:WD40 repeat protein/serine/threonine protein kinase
MAESDADCQLLFGLLAVQLRILSVATVSQALFKWSESRATSLKSILIDQKQLDQASSILIDLAAEHHLAMVDGDPRRGLNSFAGSDALEALLGVLDHTLHFSSPREETIERHEIDPARGVIPTRYRPRRDEPPTEADGEAIDGSERTITFDGASEGPNFQILRPLARGGLGELFVARDANLNREVALKLIQKAQTADPQSKARFLLEAEITGGLEHPGIVPVYALGQSADGRPFYTMRLVRGETLKERIRKFQQTGAVGRESLEFRHLLNHFGRICEVVAYAHSRGVLHRDLKPSNVMLGKFGETLVVDWGLAKPIERPTGKRAAIKDEPTLRPMSGSSMQGTLMGATVGTPQYMSPEQAMGQLDRIGPASDIYSLGATLYCILTGKPPLEHINDVGEILRRVALGDIAPACAVKPEVPGTLDAICKRAMALQPENRYQSALDLATDIERWLADEPVQGVREQPGLRFGRWERRHRGLLRVSGLALITIALMAIAAAFVVNRARERAEDRRQQAVALGKIAEEQKKEADRQRDGLRRLTTRLTLDRGLSLLEHNDRRAGLLWLARSLMGSSGPGDPYGRAIRINLAAWSRSLHRLRDCLEHRGPVRFVAWSPTGRSVATGSDDGTARLWDPVSGEPLSSPLAHTGPITGLVYSHDGKTLATASEDQTARLWNVSSGLARGEPIKHHGPVTSLAFTPGDDRLATASDDGTVRLWNAATGRPEGAPLDHGAPLKTVIIAPDGRSLASVNNQGAITLWDLATFQKRAGVDESVTHVLAVAFSPDGSKIACGGEDSLLRLVEVSTAKLLAVSAKSRHIGPILAVAFASDGMRIATGSYDTSCRLWQVPDLLPLGPSMEHRGHVWAIAFNPAGTLMAAAGDDNTTQIWDVGKFARHGDPLPHQKPVRSLAFSSDGGSILTGCDDNAARIWQLGESPAIGQVMKHGAEVRVLAPRPDGQAFATVAADGVVRLWDALTTRQIARQDGHDPTTRVEMAFHPGGTSLVSADRTGKIRRWNGSTLAPIEPPFQMKNWVRRLAFSPDGNTLAAGDQAGDVGFWDTRSVTRLATTAKMQHSVTGLAYNHDGTRLAVCDSEGEARIWDVARLQPIGERMRHKASIHTAVFSPDGTRLATASYDKTARIWNALTQEPVGPPLTHHAYVWSVEFSPDGKRLLTGSFDGSAQVWDAHSGHPIGEPMNDADMIYGAAFSQDGSLVLTFGRSRSARLWDPATSRPLGEPFAHDQEIFDAAFLPGRPVVATASRDGTARLWSIPSPMAGTPARLSEEMTVLTGMELGSDDTIHLLDIATWKQRRAELKSDKVPQ